MYTYKLHKSNIHHTYINQCSTYIHTCTTYVYQCTVYYVVTIQYSNYSVVSLSHNSSSTVVLTVITCSLLSIKYHSSKAVITDCTDSRTKVTVW